MIKQQLKHFRLGLGILFLTFSGYYLPTYLQLKTVLAQPTANQNLGQNIEADRLFQEAEQSVGNETQFINALTKYKQALRIYRQIGDNPKATATRQRLETILATSLPLAEKYEQEMDKDEAAFLAQFPKTENNQTANKLEEFAASQLGITLIGRSGDSLPISESQQKAFQDIKGELSNYLDTQGQNATSSFSEVPPKLREYLEKNTDKLTAIRTLLLNNESPRWGTDMSWISEGDLSYPLPNYLGLVDLQKLFAIDILYKQQQEKTKEVQEALEASWKLGQSFKNNPFLTGQFISIISTRVQLGVMQKLDGLPSVWQQHLLEHDYHQSISQSLTGESLFLRAAYRHYDKLRSTFYSFGFEYLDLGWSEWSEPVRQNFLRWEGIVIYQMNKQIHTVITQENACSFSFDSLRSIIEPTYGDLIIQYPLFSDAWTRTGRIMVEMELTQKILQIKEMGANARNLPNIQSAICPNAQWTYQLERSNGSSIALTPLPRWAAGVQQRLPLIYSW